MIGYDHDDDGLMNVTYGEDAMKDIVASEEDRLWLNIDPVFLSMDGLLTAVMLLQWPLIIYLLSFWRRGNVVCLVRTFWASETEFASNERNVAYHTEDETADTIDFDYMTEIVKLYVATLAREAGVIRRR